MIPINSTTLRFGIGCFETIKIYPPNKPAFLDEHIARFQYGAETCLLDCPSDKEIKAKILKVLDKSSSKKNQVLRLIITEETGFTLFIEPQPDEKDVQSSATLKICTNWLIESTSPLNSFKSFNYLGKYLAKKESLRAGFDDGLLLNEKAEIVETTKANIFFQLENDLWITPSLSSGCLPGIIRAHLMKALNAEQDTIHLSDLQLFKSAIITNSLIEVQSVTQINDMVLEPIALDELRRYLRERA